MTEDSREVAPGPGDEGQIRHAGRAFLVALYAALRSLKLYPVENDAVQRALDDLESAAQELFRTEGEIEVRLTGDFLFVSGVRLRLELENYASFSHIQGVLRQAGVGSMLIRTGITRGTWQEFCTALHSLSEEGEPEDRYDALMDWVGRTNVDTIEFQPTGAGNEEEARESKELAKRTYSQGVAASRDVVNGVRLGRAPNIKRVKRAVQQIVDQVLTNETSIVGLTALRDYDEYTFVHSVNVCIFAVALGRKIGLTKSQLYDLGMTALLHDVGKARLPLEILNKPDGLTEDEWKILQTHTWRGALTLVSLRSYEETPFRAVLVAHEHHMKVDLTGYPKHIRPRALALFSRIVAVADGYDAATSRRAYQTVPIEPDEVLREMWENPRRGYDPTIVKALINLLGIYPVGTCVILDTFEVGVVTAANPDLGHLNRPTIVLVTDPNGAALPPPGIAVDLAARQADGTFSRSIVKVTNPDRYGVSITPYLL
jgi:HD-GYP domain-containing protein (c-di-GMP phosphodiesterase class II)